jgi:hypothetical protein
MAYNVYLCDILGDATENSTRLQINIILQDYFTRVTAGTSFAPALVRWLADKPQIAANELLIYFMPSTNSIISVGKGGALSSTFAFGSHWGYTDVIQGRTASEVYARTKNARVLANLAFHEAMHNKLRLDNRRLHNGDGLGGSPFVDAGDVGGLVTDTTPLTPTNIAAMAAALGNPVPQWTDGIDKLLQRRAMRDANDATWDW